MSIRSVATDGGAVGGVRAGAATDRAGVALREVFDVSTQRHRSPIGALSRLTRPASRPGRVGHDAHRHP